MAVVCILISIEGMQKNKTNLIKALHKCTEHWEIFGLLIFYCNYLSYHLLDKLLEELGQERAFNTIRKKMSIYKRELKKFRECTTLKLFCQAVPYVDDDPPPGFKKMEIIFDWPDTATLEDAERFLECYRATHNIHNCEMVLSGIKTEPCTVVWFITATAAQKLTSDTPFKVTEITKYVVRIEIAGSCVYQASPSKRVSYVY